jgi:AcrR family transcriptional regulator
MRSDSPYHRVDGREQRSTQTRARIFEAALAEFRRVGFEAASVTEVARAAGVSRPSFYFHFPTKEHVLLELQWRVDTDTCEAIQAVEDDSLALHTFVDRLMAAEEDLGSGELFRDILQMWARPPTHLDLDERHIATVAEVVRRFLARARRGGRLPMAPERAALLFLSSVFGYLLGEGESREERALDLHTLVALHLGELGGEGP